jgi:H+/Cl- antiporter ClcA
MPERYLRELEVQNATNPDRPAMTSPAGMVEQHTEPLSMFASGGRDAQTLQAAGLETPAATSRRPSYMPMVFALYLVCVVLAVLILMVLQGFGLVSMMPTSGQAPLGVPWLVLLYGLLGACASSIITLGRSRVTHLPAFVIITWFTRPYIGALLALLAYQVLNSGLFVLHENASQQSALSLLVATLAGSCEVWLFLRRGRDL